MDSYPETSGQHYRFVDEANSFSSATSSWSGELLLAVTMMSDNVVMKFDREG